MTASTDPSNRLVAVPCEGADKLVLVDPATGDSLGTVSVGPDPVHATTAAGTTFVATMGDRAVSAVAPDGTVERIETGVLGPSHLAVAGSNLFVSCSAGDSVAVIDPVDRRLRERIPVGAEPHEIAVGPSERFLYAGSRRRGRVDVVSVSERSVVGTVNLGPDARVQGVALGPDGDRGYAVDQANARVAAFETADRAGTVPADAVERVTPVGANPYDLVVTDRRVFVPGRATGTVHAFGPGLNPVTVHEGFDRPVDLLAFDGSWWVLDAGRAGLVSLAGGSVDTPAPGLSATATHDGLVLSHYDDDRVSLVTPAKGTVWTTAVPAHPFGAVLV